MYDIKDILLTDEKMLPFPEMRTKLYSNFYEYDQMKDSDIRVTLDGERIKQVFLNVNNEWILVCGSHKYRETLIPKIYKFIKDSLKIENIVECGVGTGFILDHINIFNSYTILEINTKLCEIHNNHNIINDEFYSYIKNKEFYNTVFVDRNPTINFANIEVYTNYILKYFKNKLNKNNYLLIESPKLSFEITNIVFSIYNEETKTDNYVIKL